MSGRLISPKTLGLNVGNFGTNFGSSRTGNGPCMLLLYGIVWCLNNMKIVFYWCDALGSSKMDCRIVY